jgi:hypothetical protein
VLSGRKEIEGDGNAAPGQRKELCHGARRAPFDVLLDGKDGGSIDMRDTIEIQIEPAHRTLQVRAGRYTSSRRTFDAADGTIINFRCNGAIVWVRLLASLVVPAIGLRLIHE